jgi:hypothetical protein
MAMLTIGRRGLLAPCGNSLLGERLVGNGATDAKLLITGRTARGDIK